MLIDDVLSNVPHDWSEPDWEKLNKCHEWKRYVDSEVQELWGTFSDEQKQALAQNYQGVADSEEWD